MKLLCLSDIHGEASGLRAILPDAAQGADVVILAGDLTHLGGYAEAEALLAPLFDVGIPMLAVAGNMEYDGVRRYIGEKKIDIHGRGVVMDHVGFMGLGGGTPSPFHSPWELADEEARPLLAAGLAAITEAPFKVLVSHAPPRGTRLDRSFLGQHVGSQAVRDFLDGGAVDLCICGHIHEAAGEDTIGKTLCVNLGPFKNGNYAVLGIQNGQARVDWRKR
jgi:uncharacterized protein